MNTVPHPASLGTVEFDDRGNSRWIPTIPVTTDETLIRHLAIDWLELVPEPANEVHRVDFNEVFRSGR